MRKEFSCWLSHPVIGAIGFKRILCIESGWKGSPPEITGDIFRVLVPCSISEFPNGSVAMPFVGTGDQGYPVDQMMKSILHAAVFWFRHGLNLRVLKIVVHSESSAEIAKKAFAEMKQSDEAKTLGLQRHTLHRLPPPNLLRSTMSFSATLMRTHLLQSRYSS